MINSNLMIISDAFGMQSSVDVRVVYANETWKDNAREFTISLDLFA